MLSSRFLRCGLLAVASWATAAQAATPASGTLSATNRTITYTSGPFAASNPSAQNGGAATCQNPVLPCDDFALTIDIPAVFLVANPGAKVVMEVKWPNTVEDYDIYLYDKDNKEVTKAASSADPEVMQIEAPATVVTHKLRIVPFAVAGGTTTTKITLVVPDPVTTTPQKEPTGLPPRYQIQFSPSNLGNAAGEPSIGYDTRTKRILYVSNVTTLKVTLPELTTPAKPEACDATWEDKSDTRHSVNTLDPIGFVDSLNAPPHPNRWFTGQLQGKGHLLSYSDDNGQTWTLSQGNGVNAGVDHQTLGGGPFPKTLTVPRRPGSTYANAIYYCSQDIAYANCGRSDDGGLTFGASQIVYDINTCGGLHGHVRVANDGTVYLPNKSCGGQQGVAVSEDGGTQWVVRKVPGTLAGRNDPQAAPATDGTLYFCYTDGDGKAKAIVSKDKGKTWGKAYELGAKLGLKAAMFPQAIAGDSDRATCGFLATTTAGNAEALDFKGIWYTYMSTTYDGGESWHTVSIAPNDPVQGEGGICRSGTTCGSNRNLLDFNEITLDEKGRAIYGYADGCIGGCIQDPTRNSFSDKAAFARQIGGRSLYAQFDSAEPKLSLGSCLAGNRTTESSKLSWKIPDDGASEIKGYQIFRGTTPDNLSLLFTTNTPKATFEDTTQDVAVPKYFYKVVAINAIGNGVDSNVVELPITAPPVVESACTVPGVTVLLDDTNDSTGGVAQTDIRSFHIAEPPAFGGKLVMTLKIANLNPAPPNSYYIVLFKGKDNMDRFVSYDTEGGLNNYRHGTYTAGTAGLLTFTNQGTLDPASNAKTDGTITLIATRAIMGNSGVGDVISGIDIRVRQGASAATSRDTVGGGDYKLRGIDVCAPNTAPVASLVGDTYEGPNPLTVNFTAASSTDPDAIDSVASYTFDCGDGTPKVTQSSPTLTHTYTQSGRFLAKLTVTDSRGLVSSNTSEQFIKVLDPVVDGLNPDKPVAGLAKGRFGGGSLDWLLVGVLVGLGALRRRS